MLLTKKLLPHLTEQGKVINVSSGLAALQLHSKEVQLFYDSPKVTEAAVLEGAKEFLDAIRQKNMGKWYNHAYGTSKMLLNAWSRFVLQ